MAQILIPYKIPLVSADLTQEETLKDALHSMGRLMQTVDEIFNKIENRVTEERNRLSCLDGRIATCQLKVKQLKGTKNAITVFSTAKFPAAKSLPSFYSTLINKSNVHLNPFRDAEDVQYFPLNAKYSVTANTELNGEVMSILTRLNSYGTDMERVEFITEEQGLGKLPEYIPSVGSMMLFNSDINLYQDYETQDNLICTGRIKKTEEEAKRGLASAPTTILAGDALPDIDALDLNFKPVMQEMSALELPANLPLDFLADISFTGVALPSIAPTSQWKTAASSSSAPPPLPPSADGPPPPPPSMSSVPPLPPTANNMPPPPPPSAANIPPPPPAASMGPPPPPPTADISPPVAPQPQLQPQPQDDEEEEKAEDVPMTANPKGSLFDEIRTMGMNKLRSKKESQATTAKFQNKQEEKKPLTMQEALKQRLQRRNDALSGKTDRESQARDSKIVEQARQSSIRPPPPPAPKSNNAKTLLSNVTFTKATDDDDDSEDAPPMPGRIRAVSDDDSDNMSEISMDDSIASAPMSPAVKSRPNIPAPIQPPQQPQLQQQPAPPKSDERRGSLLDTSNTTISSMLNKAQLKDKNNDSDADDWD